MIAPAMSNTPTAEPTPIPAAAPLLIPPEEPFDGSGEVDEVVVTRLEVAVGVGEDVEACVKDAVSWRNPECTPLDRRLPLCYS
jgi:hypothetical protein